MEEGDGALLVIKNALLAARMAKKVSCRLSVHGVGLIEYLVMQHLNSGPVNEVSRIELADHLGMSASGVTRLLLPMEKQGVIEKVKNPRDSRQSLVKLTAAGKRLYAEASVSFACASRELTSNLTDSQQSRMVELMAKIL